VGRKSLSSTGKEIPESVDYFIATGNYSHYFTEAFGEKPNSIEVVFLSDDLSETCRERFELRQGSKLFAYGDGVDFRVYSPEVDDYIDMNMRENSEEIKALNKTVGSKWETVLTLFFLIPKIRGVFGAWQLTTKGVKSSIPTIKTSFDFVQTLAGTVIGIPFDLTVEKVVSNKPESKNRYPVIKLVANISQGHLDKVKEFISDKHAFMGLLTEDKIDTLALTQVEQGVKNEG
jgi:hypothetical protein